LAPLNLKVNEHFYVGILVPSDLTQKIKFQTDKLYSLIRFPKALPAFAKSFTTWGAFGVFDKSRISE
jgi:hypothetical protein